jgi:peptidyl-prolyl cis-trans isomerase A (cyclophilin A)
MRILFGFIQVLLMTTVSRFAFADTPDHFSFAFETTQGEIQFECPKGWSPLGEQRLYELVSDGFFSNTAFFRVISGFVAQFGISGDPAISAKWANANIADDPVVASNVAGTLTFADAGPNTRTTQVFINLVDNTSLDGDGFSPVCKITNAEGLAVAQKLYAGYGEGAPDGKGPDQDLITSQGDAYLKANFPLLDYVQSAVLK